MFPGKGTLEMAKWLEYCLETRAEGLDDLTAALTARGLTGLVIEDEADFRRFLEENRQYWDYVDEALEERMRGAARVKFYVPDDPGGEAEARGYLAGLTNVSVTVTPLEEEDWANGWKRYYKPLDIGKTLRVVPQWLAGEPAPGRVDLLLEPGLTFGTGSHPTTQLCLEAVEESVRPGHRVLDLGCGSGILSVAALLLGAASALGVDIDPKAPDVAYENAAMNGIGKDSYQVLAGDVLGDHALQKQLAGGSWDLILANIVADVIIPLSGLAGPWLAPGGRFLCSGIIDTRAQEVRKALEANGFTVLAERERKGWYAYTCAWEKGRG